MTLLGLKLASALKALTIGDVSVQYLSEQSQRVDIQQLLQHDIQQKVLGRTIKAKGHVSQLKERFYFFPYTLFPAS